MRLALLLAALLASGCSLGQARLGAYVGVAADLATTQAAINGGHREGNPILGDNPVLVSGVVSAALLTGAYFLEPYDEKGATWFYRFVGVVRGGMAIHNLVLILNDENDTSATIDRRKRVPAPMLGMTLVF